MYAIYNHKLCTTSSYNGFNQLKMATVYVGVMKSKNNYKK